MKTTAYSYVRFSTRGQISGDSLSRQLDMARDYARRNDLALDEHSYRDLGISAFRGKNATEGALKAFLDAVDDGTIPKNTTLLVESLDRISRAEVDDALELLLSITKRGVTIVTLADEQVYNRKTIKADWSKLIVGLTYMARAHEESARKSARSKSGMRAAIQRGIKHAKCPWWLQAAPDRRSYSVIAEKAAIVREVFDIRVRGEMGAFQLAKHVNAKYGFKYGNSQVAKLLRNPAVIGTRVSQAGYEPLLDYYPAVIDKATYYDVQRLMDAAMGTRTGRPAEDAPNLLRGIARCAKCEGAMTFFRSSPRVSQRYLKCTTALTDPTCDGGFVNYDALEKEVLGTLLLDQDEAIVPLLEKKPGPVQTTNAEITALKEQQERLVEALASGVLNTRVLVDKMNALEMQIRDLESAVLEVPPDDRLFAERAWELVERHEDAKLSGDVAALVKVRREIMAAFARAVKEIRVYDEIRKRNDVRCKFTVTFRAFDGELVREYVRPALQNRFGVFNGRAAAG